jgi:outer membrane protein assembly factor BamA
LKQHEPNSFKMKYLIFILLLATTVFPQSHLTGLTVAGLPSASFQTGRGIKYGGRIQFMDYGDGTSEPYNWNLALDASNTTENQFEAIVFWDQPNIFGPQTRFDFFLQFSRLLNDDYYGIGNSNPYNPDLHDKDKPFFLDEKYHNFKHKWFALVSNIHFPINRSIKGLVGVGLFSRDVYTYAFPNKLAQELPNGMDGGFSNYIRFGVIYDSRDEEAVPTKGVWTDVLLEISHSILKSNYNYQRITFTDRRYFPILSRLTFAQRLLFEMMPGDPPFYEMSVLGNSFRKQEGLGGQYTLRGVPRLLFIGPHKFVGNFEFRLKVREQSILRQPLTFYLHTFLDVGRVWTDRNFKLDTLHNARGFGLHVKWKKDFVGALHIGFSSHKSFAIYTSFGNLF